MQIGILYNDRLLSYNVGCIKGRYGCGGSGAYVG